jgi:CarD family transcriptional regulator
MKIVTPKSKTKRPAPRAAAAKTKAPAPRTAARAQRPASAGTRRKATETRPAAPVRKPAAAARPAPAAKTKTELNKKSAAKAVPKSGKVQVAEKVQVVRKVPPQPEAVGTAKKPVAIAKPAAVAKPVVPPKAKPKEVIVHDFGPKDYIVYPTHGVGFIQAVERQEIAGITVELFVITFEKDKMTLRVPVSKAATVGMRKLSTPKIMDSALATLKGRARVKRTMWSRRAQEYEAKINSGNPVSIAEVIRDLHRSANQPDQSYSERQIYEAALERLARELAAVEKIDEQAATERLEKVLKAA